jgi:hypothetical protein
MKMAQPTLTSYKAVTKNPTGLNMRDVDVRSIEPKEELFEQDVELTFVYGAGDTVTTIVFPVPTNLDKVLSIDAKGVDSNGSMVTIGSGGLYVTTGVVTGLVAAASGTDASENQLVKSGSIATPFYFDKRYVTVSGKETAMVTALTNASYVDPNRYIAPTFAGMVAAGSTTIKLKLIGYKYA